MAKAGPAGRPFGKVMGQMVGQARAGGRPDDLIRREPAMPPKWPDQPLAPMRLAGDQEQMTPGLDQGGQHHI